MIGLLNMYKNVDDARHIREALSFFGKVDEIQYSESWAFDIEKSTATHWFVSGSDSNVYDDNAPRLDIRMIFLPKKFFLICYSMQSFLHHVLKQDIFQFYLMKFIEEDNGTLLWRNHSWGFKSLSHPLTSIETFADGIVKKCSFLNLTMRQYHPERTVDGLLEMKQFLE